MEVRCGSCNKLFRVSDDKITGTGIQFACTKCGTTVKITQGEFATYQLSKTAVSALDMFEPKPKPGRAPAQEPQTLVPERQQAPAPSAAAATDIDAAQQEPDLSSSIPDFLQEKEGPSFEEPDAFGTTGPEPGPVADSGPSLESQLAIEPQPQERAPEMAVKAEQQPGPAAEPEPKIEVPQKTATEQKSEPKPESGPELKPEPKREPVIQPRVEPKPEPKPGPKLESKPALEVPRVKAPSAPPSPPKAPRTEPAVPTPEKFAAASMPAEPSRSGKMTLFLAIAFILLVAAGYGVFLYVMPSKQTSGDATSALTSIEGLRILNPAGSIEPNGDLRISGSVENTTDKERSAWYIVADVYDAQGTVLTQIRFVNGKQIYTHKDYDVLSKRGENIQELKVKSLQAPGVVIPARGTVPFEMRYLQPPAGIASFNANLHPFDPVRLFKEMQEENK